MLLTYFDLVDALLDFQGVATTADGKSIKDCRAAVIEAMQELANAHNWSYLYRRYVLTTNAPYTTGTIAFTYSTRSVTLTTGTWPEWATSGSILIDSKRYDIEYRVSNSVLTLRSDNNPGADVAAGTSYILFQDSYSLPSDFRAMLGARINNSTFLRYVAPEIWANNQYTSGTPYQYTIIGGWSKDGTQRICLSPYPSSSTQIEWLYQRIPASLLVYKYDTGLATLTSGSTSVSLPAAVLPTTIVGSVFRVSPNATTAPTGDRGENVAAFEAIVKSRDSATVLTLETAPTANYPGYKYQISSLVDVSFSMKPLVYRLAEKSLAIMRNMKNESAIVARADLAMRVALENDNRNIQSKVAGGGHGHGAYWQDVPIGADVI